MQISYGRNNVALGTLNKISSNSKEISSSLARLSSGTKINRPADNSALYALGNSLELTRVISRRGIQNLSDGVSILSIAESSVLSLVNIVGKQKELAQQAANGVLSTAQRSVLDTEAQALAQEYQRIVTDTEFNGKKLINGDFAAIAIQSGSGTDGKVVVDVLGGEHRTETTVTPLGTHTGQLFAFGEGASPWGGPYSIVGDLNDDGIDDIVAAKGTNIGGGVFVFDVAVITGSTDGNYSLAFTDSYWDTLPEEAVALDLTLGFIEGSSGNLDVRLSFFANSATTELTFEFALENSSTGGVLSLSTFKPNFSSYTTTNNSLATGDFNGDGVEDYVEGVLGSDSVTVYTQDTDVVVESGYFAEDLSQEDFSLLTTATAKEALEIFDRNTETLNKVLGKIGASTVRLAAATDVTRENYAASQTTLLDTNMAEETAHLTKLGIIQNSSTAILAQANLIPKIALGLLIDSL